MKRSDVRYVLACVALVLMLLAPVFMFVLLYEKTAAPVLVEDQPLPVDVATDVELLPQSDQTNDVQMVPVVGQPPFDSAQGRLVAPTRGEPFWRLDWRERSGNYLPYIVAVWLLGVVVLSLRLLLQWLYAERFKRRHTRLVSAELQQRLRVLALRLSVSRPVQLLESSLVDAPTVIGFLKPVILLPASALTGLSVQQLESLLAHELAHIRRHDYLVNILQSVVETLLFYHPAVWWVSGRIRTEREHCCDDVAVKVTGNAVTYAKTLERLEHLRQQPSLALAASDGSLVNRIERVLGLQKQESRPFGWLAGVFVLAVLVGVSALTISSESQAQIENESLEKFEETIQAETAKVNEELAKISQLSTQEEKADALAALAPNLPQSGSAYVAYLKALATLPSDLKQQAIRPLTDTVSKVVGQPDWSKYPDYGSGATINYSDNSLVVATENAVAIIEFFEPFVEKGTEPSELKNGVAYRYRVLEKGTNQKQYGEGIVFENYNREVDSETGNTNVTVASGGDVSYIRAGSIIFDWSYGSEQAGWVYVDYLEPRFLGKSVFETFDLTSFTTDEKDPRITASLPPFDITEVVSVFGEASSKGVILATMQTNDHVLAMQDGKVLDVSLLSLNDGYLVAIEHPDGFVSAYANLQANTRVKVGDEVKQGDLLGYVGGGSILPYNQLRLYVRDKQGNYVDPLQFFTVQHCETAPVTPGLSSYALDVGREPYLWATIKGRVKLNDDFTELERTQTPESYIQLEERQGTNRKSVIVKKYQTDAAEYTYTVNGQEQPFDDEAKAWYDLMFARLITQTLKNYEAELTPLERLQGSRFLLTFSSSYSVVSLHPGDSVWLMAPTSLDENGAVIVQNFSLDDTLMSLNTATHYAAHNLLAVSDEVNDNKIKTYIRDLIENVDLEPLIFQKLLLLINEMKTKEAQREMVSELIPLLPNDLLREQYQQFSATVLENSSGDPVSNSDPNSPTVVHGVDEIDPNTTLSIVDEINDKLHDQGLPRFISPLDEVSDKNVFSASGLPFVKLLASSENAPVRAMNDGLIKSAQLMSQNDGYMVTVSHPNNITTTYVGLKADLNVEVGQKVKQGEVLGYLGGNVLESGNVLKLYLSYGRFYLDPTSLYEKTSSTSQKDSSEQSYSVQMSTPDSLGATPNDEIANIDVSKTPRVIPFTFDPKNWGIPELLEQPYDLKITILDESGESSPVRQKMLAGEALETTLSVYGEATVSIFINDALFSAYNP